jgi:flagellar hook-associated protein 2
MASLASFSGIGSGIDFDTLRDAIVADRSRPMLQLQSRRLSLTSKSESLKALNGKLVTLTSSLEALNNRGLGSGRSVTTSADAVVSATATEKAVKGSFTLGVTRLATALTQASGTYASTSTAVLAGGATSATFELRKGGATSGAAITIDATNNTLAGLRDAINAANAGVTASIVDVKGDGTGNQLVLTSSATGAAGRVELVETSATGTAAALDLTSVSLPDAGAGFASLDASFTINGLAVTRSTNSVSDAVEGVTFSLKATGSATVAVGDDTASYKSKIGAFVDAYNAVQDMIASHYKLDGEGKPTGVLAGDAILRTVRDQLREAAGTTLAGNGGALSGLAEIGITRGADGKLVVDHAKLNDKLQSSLADVRALWAGKTDTDVGLANRLAASFDALSDDVSGTIQSAITSYKSSIASIDKSIAAQQDRLDALRASLTRQFAAADAAIGQLNGQASSLTNMLKSLQPKTE